MDIKEQLKCQKHLNNDILYVKVNNIQDDDDVFYCELCPFSESNFSMCDCTPIKSILNWNEDSPIINLFPFNDQELIKKLKDIFQKNIYEQLPNQIDQFYDDLQAKIMQMVAESKKRSITLAQQLCEQKQKVLQQYNQAIYKDYMKTIFQNSERNTQIINALNEEQFQVSNVHPLQAQILLSNKTKAYDIDPRGSFGENRVFLFGNQQSNQQSYLINIHVNGNNQIQFRDNSNCSSFFSNNFDQHLAYLIKGNQNQSFNIETIFEIKILISKGMFEVSDYHSKQIIVGLDQHYQSKLQASLNKDFSLCFRGSLNLIHATELEQEI
ncbi:hypothetical protein TTHERM_000224589 (macronuclear) [Tetrahymena thermophila SB210]|uniref:Uncharacterized protein n=1 Tax=Tetrahymena thermophila (strain SB210) TaxID=312017 RepID=W7XIK0_TETTS|nr:hypothetical protein TTHERM_000224589 [Tetrahymena thermophila SB210]EWS74716.1 hypothetical protein TTHERM_000224589 [Tetrahymena thermophila SB210]|eukprot:XP_012652717.1 hypothetical protein TTHERM_000224589 [Tetrahymena thermophila SB210]